MPADQIDVVVHRESVVHSLIEYCDYSVIAQLGVPDMRVPIQYALTWPGRAPSPVKRLSLADYGTLHFALPDEETFRGLALARDAAERGGSMPTVFNAANERAVAKFLRREISFLDIYTIIEEAMERHQVIAHPALEEILETEAKTYEWIESRWKH